MRIIKLLDRIGSVGALLAAVAAPYCLPIFAAFSGAIGVTALGLNESVVFYTLQMFALLSVIGLAFAARRHRSIVPVALGIISACSVVFFVLCDGSLQRLSILVSPDCVSRAFGIISSREGVNPWC